MTRVVLLANTSKSAVVEALRTFRPWLAERATVVLDTDCRSPDPINAEADFAIVLGGDGTLLSQARRLVDTQMPIVGINFGKLGFLAEYSIQTFQHQWDRIVAGGAPISRRVVLEASIRHATEDERTLDHAPAVRSIGVNDVAITAGRPFRMIQMEMTINPEQHTNGTRFGGDGVIIATPTGSTAYNASAGGPILAPDVDGLIVTPICPQSLSFRSLVVNGDDHVRVQLTSANEGTTLVIDGQRQHALAAGSVIDLRVYPKRVHLVNNPEMGYWKRLARKMHWAAAPRNETGKQGA